MSYVGKKMPRHYAEDIIKLKTKEERVKALEEVPDEWKDLVKKNVEIAFSLKRKPS